MTAHGYDDQSPYFYFSASSAGNKILNADRGKITELAAGISNIGQDKKLHATCFLDRIKLKE